MENNDKNLYELGYLLIPVISEEKLVEEANLVRSAIESNGGLIVNEEQPKMRKLSYEIAHNVAGGRRTRYDDAHFGWMRFNLSPASVKKMEEELKKNPSMLRYLVINLSKELGSSKNGEVSKKSVIRKTKKVVSEKEIDKEIDNLLEKSVESSS